MIKIESAMALVILALPLSIPMMSQGFQPPSPEAQAAMRKANEEDHQKMMALLKIDKIRRGADGRDPKAEHRADYDESKANPYPTLPDPLTFNNGKKVKTAAEWPKRRAEIVEDFDREIY